jgi:hypothetical protein
VKRAFVFLGMLMVGSAMFAQQFFIDSNATTDFESVTPAIGIGIETNYVDIMAGIKFTIGEVRFEYSYPYSDYKYSEKRSSAGIYVGLAPKALSIEKWTVSFPLLIQIRFGEASGYDYENNRIAVQSGDLEQSKHFGIDFLASARAAYSLSEHWDIFAGFVFNIVKYTKYQNLYYMTTSQTGGTYSRTENFTGWLNGGSMQLGVRCTI